MQYKTCPKCDAKNEAVDHCGQCGLYYAKWLKAQLKQTPEPEKTSKQAPTANAANSFANHPLIAPWSYMEERVNLLEFAARNGFLIGMTIWGWLLIQTDPRVTTGLLPELSFYDPLISAFVFVFHEAGHVIFSIFGQFMTVAGGTLLQLLVPAGLMFAFVYRYRNPFGGAVALWLLGYAFMDAGPYCYDAMDMQLLLAGGGTGHEIGGHDWRNMLTWTNSLHLHESIALFLDTLGEVLIIVSVLWGGLLIRRQYRRLAER